jgi:glycosyltransferase involved in cell wall biosynthesis
MTTKNLRNKYDVLFFADRLPPLVGGMEMHAKYFIEHFTNHHLFQIKSIVTKDGNGANMLVLNGEKINGDFTALNSKPDIIFFNSGRWIEELRTIKKTFPFAKFIYRTGGNEILKAPLESSDILDHKARQSYWVKTINSTIDLLITNSDYTENRLREIGITCSFEKCVGGVNISALNILKTYNEVLTIFCSARFVPYKNHSLMLTVLSKLRLKGYEFKLKLAGDGPLLEEAKKQVALDSKLNAIVEFLGVLDNESACKEIANADIYMQFSKDQIIEVPGGSYIHSEGMGRSILEALSAGIFVVAGNSGALSEIVTEERGILLDLSDLEKTIGQIENILKNPPNKLPFEDKFSWLRIFNRYEQIFAQYKVQKNDIVSYGKM